MQQLTGLDTSFLNMETRTTYGHVSGLAILDPSTSPVPPSLKELKQLLMDRIHLVPPLRRRLVEVPLGLDHPYWIEDPDFDIDFHVRHMGLPAPGSPHQLAEQVARIVSRPLDRSRPLWELYLIEGLEGGLVAQLTKIHHCAIDGVSGAELLTTLLDETPEPPAVPPPHRPWRPDAEPTQIEMFVRGVWSVLGTPRKSIRLTRQAIRHLPALSRSMGLGELPGTQAVNRLLGRKPDPMLSTAPIKAPRTIFNDKITPHRRFAYGSLDLAEVKKIKKQFGVTVNDVVMALCSAALRRTLQGHRQLPEDPLVAMVPVSVRTESEKGTYGNKVSAMTASLHTDIADPIDRLLHIHASMRIAKEQHKALPADLMQNFAEFAPPAVAARAARVIARATNANLMDVPFNVVISNVPGPQKPIYGMGARLVGHFPVSAINDGIGLNITVQSYDGHLDFGIVACRELMTDVWELIDNLGAALRELTDAAAKRAAGPGAAPGTGANGVVSSAAPAGA